MRVGIDMDFTITALPELFKLLTKALIVSGHEVHIVTYRDEGKHTEEELTNFGISFTKIHLPPAGASPEKWKADVAREIGLDIMFDDSPEVLAALPESCKRIWVCDQIFNLDVCVSALRNHSKLPVIE